MNKELYKEIDLLVSELIDNGVIAEHKQTTELRSSAIRFLKSKGFIKPNNKPSQYNPTSEIYEIQKIGIEKYLFDIQEEKSVDKKIKEKTLFDLNNKYFINFIFLVFGALLGWFLTNISESNKEEGNTEKLDKVISKKNDSLIQTQTLLNEKNTLILSLKTKIDSLKN